MKGIVGFVWRGWEMSTRNHFPLKPKEFVGWVKPTMIG